MSSRRALLAMLAALLVWGRAAREVHAGVDTAPIRIDVETCPAEWDAEIRLALAVELGDERLAGPRTNARPAVPGKAPADAAGVHRLTVRCAEHRVWVVAHDAKTAMTLERTLTGDLPAATAPRVIALLAAELLTTFDPALRRRLEAPAKPSQTLAKPSRAPAKPSRAGSPTSSPPPALDDRRLSLTAGGVYRTFLSPGGVRAWGGVLDARRASREGGWSIGLGIEVADGERSTSIGETSALLASARASAGARVRLAGDRIVLSFDLGGRGGVVRLSGRSRDPDVLASTMVRPWAGPVATVRAALGPSWFCAEIVAEGGWASVSASGRVNGGPVLAASGPWLAFSLGVGNWR